MRYRALLTLTCLLALPVSAIDIGPMTAVLESTDEFMARTVTNNGTTPKIYEVRAAKISNPTASGQLLAMPPGELLYAPKRFVLHSKQQQNVKFYYKGVADDQERYYRVTFIESPAAQAGGYEDKSRKSKLDIKIELQSILVARPRQERFEYRLDQAAGSITNTGNSFFEFMVKQGCDQPDSVADNKYLLPGETYRNPKISQPGNQKLIVHQSRFIAIGKDCWPE
ncbi:fimbria/pilus periplasmic chaperone [Aeromonas piscicola]|uniref:fimbria/pilus periplasmic chaperone n=1 Tax=Aeromonas piscicola TaxID=600645 RepID=UPI0028E278C7|nr:fimbria/pilus periplasmic chaperone [Aeromonas piscicola]